MKSMIFFAVFLIGLQAGAAVHRQSIVRAGVVIEVALADTSTPGGQSWISAVTNMITTVVDTDSQPQVGIGWTCSVCDGSDFVSP